MMTAVTDSLPKSGPSTWGGKNENSPLDGKKKRLRRMRPQAPGIEFYSSNPGRQSRTLFWLSSKSDVTLSPAAAELLAGAEAGVAILFDALRTESVTVSRLP